MSTGTLRFIDLFAQQNEHRQFIYRLCYLVNYFIKPWSLVNIMYVSQAVVLVKTCLLLLLASKEVKICWATPIFISAAMFSFVQVDSFLVATGLYHNLFSTFCIAAIYSFFTVKNFPIKIISSYLFCVFSLLTGGSGVLSFIIIVPLIMIPMNGISEGNEKYRKTILLIWMTLSFIPLALYFYDFNSAAVLSGKRIPGLRQFFAYFVGFLGNIFYDSLGATISRLAGFTILVLYLFVLFHDYKQYPKLLAIASFGLLNGLLATVSRANVLSVDDAFTSRYATHSLLTFVGVVLILLDKLPKKKIRRVIMYTVLCCMVILSLHSIPLAENHKIALITSQEALRRIISTGDIESNYKYLWWHKRDLKIIFNLVKETKLDISGFTGVHKSATEQ